MTERSETGQGPPIEPGAPPIEPGTRPGSAPPAEPAGESTTEPEVARGSETGAPSAGSRMLGRLALFLILVAFSVGTWIHGQLRASLPALDDEVALPGLSAPVTVERDELGVPTVRGSDRVDVARALGFVHAQERFFQMDLMRRQAAGELAALVGPAALDYDQENRLHRFRARASAIVGSLTDRDRQLFEAYRDGVNAGLDGLGKPPWEYLVLRQTPRPWALEDILLAGYAMYFELHDEDASRDSSLGLIDDLLGPEFAAFLAPWGTEWDAPIVGPAFETPPVPSAELTAVLFAGDGPTDGPEASAAPLGDPEPTGIGSNNWAVAGSRTADGRALVANDMHLGIGVPNTWYRASLVYPDPSGGERRVTGVTLPGTPFVIVGSNGHVAWAFTNSYGDWIDLVELELDPEDPSRYRAPDGWKQLENHTEVLAVTEGEPRTITIEETIWGPVIDVDHAGRRRALRWTAHDAEAMSLGFLDLELASDLDRALDVANRIGAPPQNFVAADSSGRIGWTILGRIPRRYGFDGRTPTSWADGSRGWDGWIEPGEGPRVVDPPSGLIWTANARVVDGEMLRLIGRGDYDLGARAGQIRDGLTALEAATPAEMLAIQLDDRALFLERWRSLLLETLDPSKVGKRRSYRQVYDIVSAWSGRADVDAVGYRLVRGFRNLTQRRAFAPVVDYLEQADSRFDLWELQQLEGPLWRLVSERPSHLLDPAHESWDALLLAAVDELLEQLARPGSGLEERTWGERNTSEIRHPLSSALPPLAKLIDMAPTPLPGDSNMPRFQSRRAGASERLVVSPGNEEAGFFHMPGGQSGHPMSRNYRDGHQAWIEGLPTPFLPGPVAHTLTLLPPGGGAGTETAP